MVSQRIHDCAVKRLSEIQYISNFRWNLISLSKLDSNGYRWIVGDEILKVMHGDTMILEGKKVKGGYYYISESPV